MEDVIHPKKMEEFRSISKLMAETLRKDIFEDVGFSRLKAKALDLITELRLENAILNDEKTAARINKGASTFNVTAEKDPKQEA